MGLSLAPLRAASAALLVGCGLVLAVLAAGPDSIRRPAEPAVVAERPTLPPPGGPVARVASADLSALRLERATPAGNPPPAPRRSGPDSRRVPEPLDWDAFGVAEAGEPPQVAAAPEVLEPKPATRSGVLGGLVSEETVTREGGGLIGSLPLIGGVPVGEGRTVERRRTVLLLDAEAAERMFEREIEAERL